MLRSVLALTLVAASSAVASAGTYLGLGIGTAPSLSATTTSAAEAQTVEGNGRSGKLMVGFRFGRLAVEGAAARYGVFENSYAGDATQLSAALKYNFPLGNNFEAFVRGGLVHNSIGLQMQQASSAYDSSGNGWLLGGGFEYRLNALIAGGSVFVDYEHTSTGMTTNERATFDESSGVWMAGVTLSL